MSSEFGHRFHPAGLPSSSTAGLPPRPGPSPPKQFWKPVMSAPGEQRIVPNLPTHGSAAQLVGGEAAPKQAATVAPKQPAATGPLDGGFSLFGDAPARPAQPKPAQPVPPSLFGDSLPLPKWPPAAAAPSRGLFDQPSSDDERSGRERDEEWPAQLGVGGGSRSTPPPELGAAVPPLRLGDQPGAGTPPSLASEPPAIETYLAKVAAAKPPPPPPLAAELDTAALYSVGGGLDSRPPSSLLHLPKLRVGVISPVASSIASAVPVPASSVAPSVAASSVPTPWPLHPSSVGVSAPLGLPSQSASLFPPGAPSFAKPKRKRLTRKAAASRLQAEVRGRAARAEFERRRAAVRAGQAADMRRAAAADSQAAGGAPALSLLSLWGDEGREEGEGQGEEEGEGEGDEPDADDEDGSYANEEARGVAATRVQAAVRGNAQRREQVELRMHERAALALQGAERTRVARNEVKQLRQAKAAEAGGKGGSLKDKRDKSSWNERRAAKKKKAEAAEEEAANAAAAFGAGPVAFGDGDGDEDADGSARDAAAARIQAVLRGRTARLAHSEPQPKPKLRPHSSTVTAAHRPAARVPAPAPVRASQNSSAFARREPAAQPAWSDEPVSPPWRKGQGPEPPASAEPRAAPRASSAQRYPF
ncbi:hypothetical protein T492DRAFT_1151728 [Pavlovales sp. CCMP2436]|nr:hypothetical protein T492DRAFT_1151728 [Pavlovales sp. CCMP2436]